MTRHAAVCTQRTSLIMIALLALGAGAVQRAHAQDNASAALAPSVQSDLGDAHSLVRQGRHQDAIALLRRADDASQGQCIPCLELLAEAFAGLEAHRNVADVSRRLLALQPDATVLARAYRRLGLALLTTGKTEPAALEEAAAAFRSELELSLGEATLAHYHLGEALIRMGKREKGVAELRLFLERDPTALEARAARQYVANPSCVLTPCLPDVSVLTRDGELVPLTTYRGRVLVLHFWGPWSDLRTNILSSLERVARKHADRPITFLAISGEVDRDSFVQSTADWEYTIVPVSDPEGALAIGLDVANWPTTIVADPEGKIVHRSSGWRPATIQEIQRALRDAARSVGS